MLTFMYWLYLIRCANGSLYTGITTDVHRRFEEHASGKVGAKYTKGKGPLKLVFATPIGDRSLASQYEYAVKRLTKPQKEILVA